MRAKQADDSFFSFFTTNSRTLVRIFLTASISAALSLAQTVSGTIVGQVVDPGGNSVPKASATLRYQATGEARTASSDDTGTFRFLNASPGAYDLLIEAGGFEKLNLKNVALAVSETRDLGRLSLTIGATTQSVDVTAQSASLQLSSSEKAAAINGDQLSSVTLKGRDLFGYVKLIPGVVDSTASRDVTSPSAIAGITINGNTSAINFTVDGITSLGTGSNQTVQYEPNMDAVQEMKVLTSNYQAEFGRNSGGTISVVTKSGAQQFHGTGAWNHRHEQFNANSWVNNHTPVTVNGVTQAAAIQPYRYNIETWSFGGPVYVPKHFNTSKTRLFFFASQEYTGQRVSGGSSTRYTPTALERSGNFSKTLNNNGSVQVINDPTLATSANPAGLPFSGNIIPQSRISALGLSILNFFPAPNFNPILPAQLNVVNYFEQESSTHPRRDDVIRIDGNVNSKITAYFRYINDYDTSTQPFSGVTFGQDAGGLLGANGIASVSHPNGGNSYSWSSTQTITPTLVNEVTIAKSWNEYSFSSDDNFVTEDRSLIPGLPTLFPIPTTPPSGIRYPQNGYQNLLPQFSFGSLQTGASAMSYTRIGSSAGAYRNSNPIYTYQDNLSKILGRHTLKAGLYLDNNPKLQPGGQPYPGSFNFGPNNANFINNTGNGYANALLGDVATYSQATGRATFLSNVWTDEFYIQDSWKVTRRLTLDLGIRFTHQVAEYDQNKTFAEFEPNLYSKSQIPRIYVAGCSNGAKTCSGVTRVAVDPGTGAAVPASFIGLFVPGTGNPNTGMVQLGVNGVDSAPYLRSFLAPAPRVGFAYDLFGNGKTAIRGGWGRFYNRLQGNVVYSLSGQAPVVSTPQVYFTTFAQIAAANGNGGVIGPNSSISTWDLSKNTPWDGVENWSIDIQHQIGSSTVVDVGYTGNRSFNQLLQYNINSIPLGSRAPFTPSAADPTTGSASYASDIFLRTTYPGYGAINQYAMLGHSNYNALTLSVNRRLQHGLAGGVAYTYAKALGLTAYNPLVPNNEQWNYGRLDSDRRNNIQINYSYDLPKFAHIPKVLGVIANNWQLSGVTSIQSGKPYNPSCGYSSGTLPDYTGTPDVSARSCFVVGDPNSNVPDGSYFNPNAYRLLVTGLANSSTYNGPPILGNLGGGAGALTLPGVVNFDATLTKIIPLGSEKRLLKLQVQAYNVFNHTEVSSAGSSLQFNPSSGVLTNASSIGIPTGALPNRQLALSARVQF